jgi:hypothetical protein
MPIKNRTDTWAFGFCIQIAKSEFDEFVKFSGTAHPKLTGRITQPCPLLSVFAGLASTLHYSPIPPKHRLWVANALSGL